MKRFVLAWGFLRHFGVQTRMNLRGAFPWYSLRNAWRALLTGRDPLPSVEDMKELFKSPPRSRTRGKR